MKIKETILVTVIGTLSVLVILFGLKTLGLNPPLGQAAEDSAAFPLTSTNSSLAVNTVSTLTATTSCVARIISTGVVGVHLTFSDTAGDTLTGRMGHIQAASTTVNYNSNVYGCGLVRVRSDGAATQIRITEVK